MTLKEFKEKLKSCHLSIIQTLQNSMK